MTDPIRIFVGTSPDGDDAEAELALEYSIRSRTAAPVEFTWMRLTNDKDSPWCASKYNTVNWVTPFSGFRWEIPKACKYKGRAIYMDVDMLCRADIADLWNADLGKAAIMAREARRFCVMLIDCEKARAWPELRNVRHQSGAVIDFPTGQRWNCLDGDGLDADSQKIKILHFTSIDSQPHIPHALQRLAKEGRKHWYDGPVRPHWRPELTAVWQADYDAAIAAGYTTEGRRGDKPFGLVTKRPLSVYHGLRPK